MDPYDVSCGLLALLRLDLLTARRMLRDSLDRLRVLRPGFYAANVAGYLEKESLVLGSTSQQGPEELFVLSEEKDTARRTLGKLLKGGPVTTHRARARGRYQDLLARICADVPPSGTEFITWITSDFGITMTAAERFLRRLVRLVALADLDWVVDQCHAAGTNRD
ncbi:hypothetical protein [Nonomuraea sp. NPDC046570]|uniref:hypothetical protein n=1 Tax=Nonomuraea sp. NPDC046570 TaxID=3155255 RepID=UPI0033E57B44